MVLQPPGNGIKKETKQQKGRKVKKYIKYITYIIWKFTTSGGSITNFQYKIMFLNNIIVIMIIYNYDMIYNI